MTIQDWNLETFQNSESAPARNVRADVINAAKTFTASTGNTTTTTLSAIAAFDVSGISRLGVELVVGTTALNSLQVYGRHHASGNYVSLGLATDWSAGGYPVIDSDITTALTSVAVGSHWAHFDVSALESIQFWASVASGTGGLDLYAGGLVNG